MINEINLSSSGTMLVYKKGYTYGFVKDTIATYKLEGLRIFDHLDALDSLDFLKDYNFLEKLSIDCILDQNYSFLKNLTKLKYLGIGISVKENNPIDLSNQQNLESLDIHWRKGKIIGLEKCRNIKTLIIWSFKEKDFNAISHLSELVDLEVKTGSVETTAGLENLKHLESLSIAYCPRLKSIKEISSLKKLSSLEIWACSKIEDYDELKGLDSLTSLKIVNGKGISSIKFIQNFPALNKLSLSGNTVILDGDLTPAKNIEKVFYKHYKHYNIRIENKEIDQLRRSNLEKIKARFR